MEGLAPIDGWAITAIIAKAVGYGAALLAMGGPLFVLVFRSSSNDVQQLALDVAKIQDALNALLQNLRN